MSASKRHYFAGGNTAQGFIDYFASNLQGLEKVFILKGGPGTGKSTLMKSIGQYFNEKDFETEWIHCSSDPDSLDGIIIPGIKSGIIDGTSPHVVEPTAPGAIEEYVNLGTAWDSKLLEGYKDEILKLKEEISQCFQNTYLCFENGLKVHDEWEKIYIQHLDIEKANALTNDVVNDIIGTHSRPKTAMVKHRFFGASTPFGPMDYIPNLTDEMPKRFFITGRPGTGKSTLLKTLVSASSAKGLDVEVYHCAFDSKSLDMVILPELTTCIFDCTAPHFYTPSRPTDTIIDMYATCITPGVDEKYAGEIEDIVKRYSAAAAEGTNYLKKAKDLHDEMEKYYVEAMDFERINLLREVITRKLQARLEV